ncbi:hypothetical protein BDV59DRAFT_211573 [Aspergillus ambiguus]|uniref:uncharacterized protein n=1 Tax=Aspergillus ambiguus TaxID=176160 RepID=UPI003CCCA90D
MGAGFENVVETLFGSDAAQHLRKNLHEHGKYRPDEEWAKDIILMDVEMREAGQREAYLRGEVEALEDQARTGDLTDNEKVQIEKWRREIEDLARQYWHLEREFYRREASCPSGPMLRGYQAWRKNPDGYLKNKFLRLDCAGRGGCCGRGCGCCGNKRFAGGREIRRGHCTVECGCCRRARGFEMSDDDKSRFKKLFDDCDIKVNQSYSNALKLAYIFGLSE